MSAALSVAIVTYRTPASVLRRTLDSLARAILEARASGMIGAAEVFIIDNSPAADAELIEAARGWPQDAGRIETLSGHGNLGYGAANDIVLDRLRSDLHLVLNPDVELAADALAAAVRVFSAHPGVGLVAPDACNERGEREYLCKRYPSPWVLFLRGFAPSPVREQFRRPLDEYEMRDVVGDRLIIGVPLASGCFMLVRTALFRKLGGFDARFFMYFEDYDLSMRLGRESAIAFAPEVRITHGGGHAARKGWRHVIWFTVSAVRFFSTHGWRSPAAQAVPHLPEATKRSQADR